MPKIHEMVESKFLKKEDVGSGVLATIKGVSQQNVAMQNQAADMKWCLDFKELDKPLVLNTTNMRIIEAVTGSDDTDDWIGKEVVLYTDPNIMYAGKVVGGIRVRAPRMPSSTKGKEQGFHQPRSRPTAPPVEPDEPPVSDEDIPF